jgi:hypothetical protein
MSALGSSLSIGSDYGGVIITLERFIVKVRFLYRIEVCFLMIFLENYYYFYIKKDCIVVIQLNTIIFI